MTDYDPRPLTDAELLAWAVIIEYRNRRIRDGAAILLPYPCCPTCGSHVIRVEVLPSRLATLTQPIVMHPCGHGYLTDDNALDRIHRHAEAMLDILDGFALGQAGQPWWNTDGIIREAQLRVAVPEPAATEATDAETTARSLAGMHASAEQTVNRVIDLYERWLREGPPKLGTLLSREWDRRLAELHAAIQPPAISPDTVEGPGAVPAAIKQIVDRAAGKDHSATGAVMTCLSEVLAAHRQIIQAEAGTPANDTQEQP